MAVVDGRLIAVSVDVQNPSLVADFALKASLSTRTQRGEGRARDGCKTAYWFVHCCSNRLCGSESAALTRRRFGH